MDLGYWTVPAPGALFVTGGRFWPIVRALIVPVARH
jgi:hypothetical protein